MLPLEQTDHSRARLRQRGLRETDAQLIVQLGTEFRTGVFMLTDSEVDALIAELSAFADPQGNVPVDVELLGVKGGVALPEP